MDLPEAQGSCHVSESKSGIPQIFFACLIWNLGNFDGGNRDPRLWNPESTA